MGKIIKNSSGKVLTASGGALEVTAAIDSNIVAGNIKKDVEILGVVGSYEGSGGGASTTNVTIQGLMDGAIYYLANGGTVTAATIDAYTLTYSFSCVSGSIISIVAYAMVSGDLSDISVTGATQIYAEKLGSRTAYFYYVYQAN